LPTVVTAVQMHELAVRTAGDDDRAAGSPADWWSVEPAGRDLSVPFGTPGGYFGCCRHREDR
jgi:hypothetical protein